MTETKEFHIGDVLSAMTGKLVSPDHIGGVYSILGWMVDEELFTHQLPRVSRECEPFLRDWFRDLANIVIPDTIHDEASLWEWLTPTMELYGEFRDVPRIPTEDHASIGPLTELMMMRGGTDGIIPVIVDGGS